MGLSLPHILLLAVVAVLLLGGGRFSAMMGDVAKGVKNFKKGMAEEDEPARPAPRLQSQAPLEPNADPHLQPMQDDRPRH
ncbi:twin-arginine translocase TatA/TatE family subunit [Sphingomonas morindae]|uniref:Sec-independent protein translocase protein TatA n=1 Tax=Sphingomonas morindae TaxID=1541170 RepID=A0ABY4X8R2_9SPHN|nr:twin-arginine translocase TatA/TatE family subunit [Sphingomonas morindae]USI73301.1 twin-arginine translocase TatA/TatE family subunit [Sphingomonas morindae]